MGGSRSRDVQNLAYGSGVGGSRSKDVQDLAYGSGVGGSRSSRTWHMDQGWVGPGVAEPGVWIRGGWVQE